MKKYRHVFTLTVLFLTATVNAQKPGLPPNLDNYINKVLQTFDVPGVSVAIVKDGKVLLAKGYGVKKLGEPAPVDEHTLFCIASNTKAFTATALAILVEEGKLKWEDRVIDYLPWFRMSDTYVTANLTIRDLLVHHSGIPAYAGDLMLFPPSDYTRKEILSKLKNIPLVHDFRTVYAYDNILYLAAGEVIVAASHMEWEDFIKTRILDKIGMSETLSRFSSLKNQQNVSSAHSRYGGKVQVINNFNEQVIGDAGDPAGGIASNATDVAKWMITQLDSGRTIEKVKVFNASSTKQLWSIVRPIPIGDVPVNIKPAKMDFFGYALGFRTYNYQKYKVVGHGGKLDGFVSQVAMVPDLNLGIMVLTNQESSNAYWSIIYQVLDYYTKNEPFDWIGGFKKQQDTALVKLAELEKKSFIQPTATARASLPYEKYAGNYRDTIYGDISIIKDSAGLVLRFNHTPQLVADLEYFQYDTFIARFRNKSLKCDAYTTFALNEDETINQVKMKIIDPDSDLSFDDLLLRPVKERK